MTKEITEFEVKLPTNMIGKIPSVKLAPTSSSSMLLCHFMTDPLSDEEADRAAAYRANKTFGENDENNPR